MKKRIWALSPSFPLAAALRETLGQGYRAADFRGDLAAGLTVGIVAVPLAMALAVACDVPPQHGLYTAIIAGALIALTGGSRLSVSGPTAAFVVILLPVVHQYGLGGLLIATIMSGLILIGMGLTGMGRMIQYIPYPVTTGFTAGIAVVIAFLQVKDFLGLSVAGAPEHFIDKALAIGAALPSWHPADTLIGCFTLAVLIAWRRLKPLPIPAHLAALALGAAAAVLLTAFWPGFTVDTIGSRFQYTLNGVVGQGIPPLPPIFEWPWLLPDAQGNPIGLSGAMLRQLIPVAFTIAMLGAIESLLCAVVADGISDTRHNPNAELVGQGLGNVVAPFFGGITATAAIARTATNIRAGAKSPLAAIIHALVALLAMVGLAGLLSRIPMAALAALLLIVAWDMSERKRFAQILRAAPRSDVAVLLTCFGLTVFLDMVVAVAAGIVLASLLFIRRMAELSGATLLTSDKDRHLHREMPDRVAFYEIRGPLFFGAADKAIGVIQQYNREVLVVVIDLSQVPDIDMTGIVAMETLLARLHRAGLAVVICGANHAVLKKLLRAGIRRRVGRLIFRAERQRALKIAAKLAEELRDSSRPAAALPGAH